EEVVVLELRGLPVERGTGNVGVPVHKGAIGIVLPGPDMQGIERRQPKTVGALKIMKELTHELGRAIRVLLTPHVGKNEIVSADEFLASVRHRLVDHDLRTSGVNNAAGHKGSIHVMEAHRARIGSAHTSELQDVAFSLRRRYVLEAFR